MCAKTHKNTQTLCMYTDNAHEDKHTHIQHTRSKTLLDRRLCVQIWTCEFLTKQSPSPLDLCNQAKQEEGMHTYTQTHTPSCLHDVSGAEQMKPPASEPMSPRLLPFSFVPGTLPSCSSSASPSRPLLHSHPLPPDSSSVGRPREP